MSDQYPPQAHFAEYVLFSDHIGLSSYGLVATAANRQRMRGTGITQGTVLFKGREIQWKLREAHEVQGAHLPDRALDKLPVEPVLAVVAAKPAPSSRPVKSRHKINPSIRKADLEKVARKTTLSDNARAFLELRAGLEYRYEELPISHQLVRLKGAAVTGLNRSLAAYKLQLVVRGRSKKEAPKPPRNRRCGWLPKLPPLAQQIGSLRPQALKMLNRALTAYGLQLARPVVAKPSRKSAHKSSL